MLDEGEAIPASLYVDMICAKIRSLEYPGGLHLGGGLEDSALFLPDGTGELEEDAHEDFSNKNNNPAENTSSSKGQSSRISAFGRRHIPGGKEVNGKQINGWMLIGFPNTSAEAKLLEKALTGFVGPRDLDPSIEPTERTKKLEEAQLMLPGP